MTGDSNQFQELIAQSRRKALAAAQLLEEADQNGRPVGQGSPALEAARDAAEHSLEMVLEYLATVCPDYRALHQQRGTDHRPAANHHCETCGALKRFAATPRDFVEDTEDAFDADAEDGVASALTIRANHDMVLSLVYETASILARRLEHPQLES